MKLYKLLQEVILEEKKLLTENVSDDEIIDAIDNKYNVNITYDDFPGSNAPPSKRYIQVYNLNTTKAGNKAIRAYQIFGGSKTTPREGAWKLFRVDRIRSWEPTRKTFSRPVSDYDATLPKYNMSGQENPRSPVASVSKSVSFGKPAAMPSGETERSRPLTPQEKATEKLKAEPQKLRPSSYAGPVPKPEPQEKSPIEKSPVDTSATTGPKPKPKPPKPKI